MTKPKPKGKNHSWRYHAWDAPWGRECIHCHARQQRSRSGKTVITRWPDGRVEAGERIGPCSGNKA